MPKIKTKKILPKSVRRKLGIRAKYIELDDLLEEIGKALLALVSAFFAAIFGRGRKKTDGAPRGRPTNQTRSPVKPQPQSPLRVKLEQAYLYQAELAALAQNPATRPLQRERLADLTGRTRHWVASVEQLVERIERSQDNALLQRDLKTVPEAIRRLEKRLEETEDPVLRADLERTLTARRTQFSALERLDAGIHRAELKVESTVSMLGAIYSQVLLGQSTHDMAGFRRMLDDVDAEVHSVQDYVTTLQEVTAGTPATATQPG